MNIETTAIPGVLIVNPKVFGDERGFFLESFNEREMRNMGIDAHFVQDNHSRSSRNVLRGLHYQLTQPQGKLVRVVSGKVFDVAVDMRRESPSFGKWLGVELSAENKRIFWLPPGIAHGFVVLSDSADFLYKTTDYYAPQSDRTLLWNDHDIGIEWPFTGEPTLSPKDMAGKPFHAADAYEGLFQKEAKCVTPRF